MFFLFGVVSGMRDLGERSCMLPCCGMVRAVLTCSFHQFTLFFVPLFRFQKRYFLTCPRCGSIYALSKEEGRRLERAAVRTAAAMWKQTAGTAPSAALF